MVLGMVRANTLLEKRIEEILLRGAPQWISPLHNTITDPISVWEEGWVTPGAPVRIEKDLFWYSDNVKLNSPQKPKVGKIENTIHCQKSVIRDGTEITCFIEGYAGFYWGKPKKVSGTKSCDECIFAAEYPSHINYKNSFNSNWNTTFLMDLIHPKPPKQVKIQPRAQSALNVLVFSQISKEACVWFKPLMWANSGWFLNLKINTTSTIFQSFQLDLKFPVTLDTLAEGAYGVFPENSDTTINFLNNTAHM
ncbi:hypothetical protein DSO57_1030695 [Entomophthora muscae]|uniref:Uncharacterized protein n=1 Tax=Entomophthora muscae TaxID=34485 RepID=A0ACC2TNA0_9FUNG|nr:hypothetical protein DSO57_1030695 [Entomophthora muscae]